MLLLNKDQVQFCKVSNLDSGNQLQLDGFIYLNCLFIKGELFYPEQKNEALSRIQELLDRQEDAWGVLLQQENGFSLWYCHGKVNAHHDELTVSAAQTQDNSRENISELTETQTELLSSPQPKKISHSFFHRLKQEWEDSFRLSN